MSRDGASRKWPARTLRSHGGDAAKVVVLAVFANAVVDLRRWRDHPVDELWANSRTRGVAGQNSRTRPSVWARRRHANRAKNEIGPLPAALLAVFHTICRADSPHFANRKRAAGASVPRLISDPRQRSRAAPPFQAQDRVDHRHAILDRDLRGGISHRGARCWHGWFYPEESREGQKRLRVFLQRDFAHYDRNLKGARHLMNGNVRRRREGAQFASAWSTRPWTYGRLNKLATTAKCFLPLAVRGRGGASLDIRQSAGRARLCRAANLTARASAPFSSSSSRDTSRYADWLRCESAPAPPSGFRNLRGPRLFWDCS